MSNLSSVSKKQLLSMLVPVIKDWCNCTGYVAPPTNWLLSYTFDFRCVVEYTSYYNGKEITAIGTHYNAEKLIVVASARKLTEVIATVIHELAHAVQSFNLPTTFGVEYAREAAINTHDTNKFECQARRCEYFLAMHTNKNKDLVDAMLNFVPVYERPPLRMVESNEWEYYRPEVKYYNDPKIGDNRKRWWLRK